MKEKTLFIIRHAHRSKKFGRHRDNGLSAKGIRQARQILEHYLQIYGNRNALILTSPKKRCVETVAPIGHQIRATIETNFLLDEQQENESLHQLRQRVRQFHQWWVQKGPKLTVVCSHGDWIPVFLDIALGRQMKLSKGGWCEVKLASSGVKIRFSNQDKLLPSNELIKS